MNIKSKVASHADNEKTHEKVSGNNINQINLVSALNVLGLNDNAGIDEIKSVYKTKLKEYHPDKVASLGIEIRDLAAKKTLEINEAYNYIKKIKGFD